jgi:parallel beta-helix repeat protein
VTKSGQPVSGLVAKGIHLENTTDSLIADTTVDHNTNYGIYIFSGSTRNQIVGNRVFANARQYERAASGIRVYLSTGNTVASNVSYGNEDSGIELANAAHDNLVVNNITYGNGDHGIDVTQSSLNARLIANSVYTSVTSGINVEGASTGAAVINNVAVDNAVNSPRGTGNIRVDATATSGVTIDYNLVSQTGTGRNYEWKGLGYNTIEQMRTVSGQEAHGIQANPRWASPADGDFSLTPGSPAIDSANSGASGQLSSDAENRPRLDDPGTPNSGVGPRAYDDRGALEYEAENRPWRPSP